MSNLKKHYFFLMSFAAVILFLLSFLGCAGKKKEAAVAPPAQPASVEPEWVRKGAGAFLNKGDKAFYGIGSVSGVMNKSLARTTADNRARAELAKVFETYSASLMRDYAASTTAGDFKKTSEEQNIEQAVKTFSAATLSGVIIIDHWTDPQDNTIYALAKLDLENFKETLNKMKELNAEVRDFVRKNAEKAFEKLEAEEQKREAK
ncbi:MAG: LPP20 family lipoprotein [Nitrospirae bacterium]|nr:LPP20 family lipoprotein [Nitrospirota bacterium]